MTISTMTATLERDLQNLVTDFEKETGMEITGTYRDIDKVVRVVMQRAVEKVESVETKDAPEF